jgi:hypothetical protein
MSDERPKEPIKRGPKGGRKHKPGRGHRSKSAAQEKKRFARRARKKRKVAAAVARRAWQKWDAMSEEAKKLLWDKRPQMPRPDDATETTTDGT